MSDHSDLFQLRREVMGLFAHIQKMRHEIASIHRPNPDKDRFTAMSDELDAIVEATESATNTIMESVEALDEINGTLMGKVEDPEAQEALARTPALMGAIFEACSFQDITGQRITKVVTSLKFIEEKVNNLISMWGPEQINEMAGSPDVDGETLDEYKKYLHGPALAGEGVSQADVDAMFDTPVADTAVTAPASAPAAKAPAAAKLTLKATAKPAKQTSAPAPAKAPAPGKAPAPDKAPAPANAPAPAAKKKPAPAPAPAETGNGMGQSDIDKLFD